eukprot:528282-Pyramimonas_sp.AAC.1
MEVAVHDRQSLVGLWDFVSEGIHFECQFLWGRVGPAAVARVGRSEAPTTMWKKLAWAPPRWRPRRDSGTNAWATALRWATHLGKARKFLAEEIQRLAMSAAVCDLHPKQWAELVRAFSELANFMASFAKRTK